VHGSTFKPVSKVALKNALSKSKSGVTKFDTDVLYRVSLSLVW